MRKLTASNLIASINQLDKNVVYNYVNTLTKGVIKIEGVDLPEGPIRIKRWNPAKGETEQQKSIDTISSDKVIVKWKETDGEDVVRLNTNE